MNNFYCEECSNKLNKCSICGEDIVFDKALFRTALEEKRVECQEELTKKQYEYLEAALLVINAQLEKLETFISLKDAYKLREEVTDAYYEALRKRYR